MPSTNAFFRKRLTSIVVVIALTASGAFAFTRPAAAEPPTTERRTAATQVADSVCRTVPPIPLLPKAVDPHKLCVSVIVENIDPDGHNTGVRAACLDFLPKEAKVASRGCEKVLNTLLGPARKIFLERVVPVAAHLACMATSPGAFDCLAQQVHVWLRQATTSLWQGLLTVLTSDTQAVKILQGWSNRGIVSLYSDVGSVAATLLLGLVLVSLIGSVIRFDFRRFGSVLLGAVTWGVFWSSGVAIAVLLIMASDSASRWLAGHPDASGQTDLDRAGEMFGDWIDYVSAVTRPVGASHPLYSPGSLTALLICSLLIIAIIVVVVALLMRNIALLLLIMLLPITLAGFAGPGITRHWMTSALRMFVALLLAKPLIVIAIRLGAVLVAVPRPGEAQATFSDALLGVSVILLAGLLPGVIYRFSGGLMATSAGAAPRAGIGVSEQAAHSGQSTMDLTRLVMERNVLRHGGGGTAGALGGSGGRMPAGVGAASGRLSTAAAPLGLAVAAGALVGGTVESGGRWMAGQAATGGGVFGDVDAPRVPAPPVSRLGHGAAPHTGGAGGQVSGPQSPTLQPPDGSVKVMQQHPASSPRAQLPSDSGHLIIPGEVAADMATVDRGGSPPRALPGGDGDD